MQNREELRQKGQDGSRKTTCRKRGKKYHFQKGGGINIIFGPKYRPLFSFSKNYIFISCDMFKINSLRAHLACTVYPPILQISNPFICHFSRLFIRLLSNLAHFSLSFLIDISLAMASTDDLFHQNGGDLSINTKFPSLLSTS